MKKDLQLVDDPGDHFIWVYHFVDRCLKFEPEIESIVAPNKEMCNEMKKKKKKKKEEEEEEEEEERKKERKRRKELKIIFYFSVFLISLSNILTSLGHVLQSYSNKHQHKCFVFRNH
jgi:uncharacterized membrane protein YcjF (UPF0283 family)